MPALSAKKVLDVLQHASGPFSPAALASDLSLGLVTNLVLLECLRTVHGEPLCGMILRPLQSLYASKQGRSKEK